MDLAVAAIAAIVSVAVVVVGLGLFVVFTPTLRGALVRVASAVQDVACDLFGGGFVTGAAVRARRQVTRRSAPPPSPAGVGAGPSVNQGSDEPLHR